MATLEHPPPRFSEARQAAVDAFERDYFTRLHDIASGNVSEIARLAGMQRAHVRVHLHRHGIGGRAPQGRPRDAAKAALARLTAIIAPREGETLEEAAARLAKRRGSRKTGKK